MWVDCRITAATGLAALAFGTLAAPGEAFGALARKTGNATTSMSVSGTSGGGFIGSQQAILDPTAEEEGEALSIHEVRIDLTIVFDTAPNVTAQNLIRAIDVQGFENSQYAFVSARGNAPTYRDPAGTDPGESVDVFFSDTSVTIQDIHVIAAEGQPVPAGAVDFAVVNVSYDPARAEELSQTTATYILGPYIPPGSSLTADGPMSFESAEVPATGTFIRAVSTLDGSERVFGPDEIQSSEQETSLAVPEPASGLAAAGLGLLALRRRR